jgi:hypothetical protein
VRKGGAIGKGLLLTLSTEWQREQLVRTKTSPLCSDGENASSLRAGSGTVDAHTIIVAIAVVA